MAKRQKLTDRLFTDEHKENMSKSAKNRCYDAELLKKPIKKKDLVLRPLAPSDGESDRYRPMGPTTVIKILFHNIIRYTDGKFTYINHIRAEAERLHKLPDVMKHIVDPADQWNTNIHKMINCMFHNKIVERYTHLVNGLIVFRLTPGVTRKNYYQKLRECEAKFTVLNPLAINRMVGMGVAKVFVNDMLFTDVE